MGACVGGRDASGAGSGGGAAGGPLCTSQTNDNSYRLQIQPDGAGFDAFFFTNSSTASFSLPGHTLTRENLDVQVTVDDSGGPGTGITHSGSTLTFKLLVKIVGASDVVRARLVISPLNNFDQHAVTNASGLMGCHAYLTLGRLDAAGSEEISVTVEFNVSAAELGDFGAAFNVLAVHDRIAFLSFRTGTAEIFTMNPDGSDQFQVTDTGLSKRDPSWSFDAGTLMYHEGPVTDVDLMQVSPAGDVGPTAVLCDTGNSVSPEFSFDDALIFFTREFAGSFSIWNLDPDSGRASCADSVTGLTSISTTTDPSEAMPVPSPDGQFLAYHQPQAAGRPILIQRLAGNTPVGAPVVVATDTWINSSKTSWSPDSSQLVFNSEFGTNGFSAGVITMDMPSTLSDPALPYTYADEPGQFTQEVVNPVASTPTISPDGTQVAYSAGSGKIFIEPLEAAGGGARTNLIDEAVASQPVFMHPSLP